MCVIRACHFQSRSVASNLHKGEGAPPKSSSKVARPWFRQSLPANPFRALFCVSSSHCSSRPSLRDFLTSDSANLLPHIFSGEPRVPRFGARPPRGQEESRSADLLQGAAQVWHECGRQVCATSDLRSPRCPLLTFPFVFAAYLGGISRHSTSYAALRSAPGTKARNCLSYEAFNNFLASIKRLNNQRPRPALASPRSCGGGAL